ncbi:hypothetical protein TetV_237 [Tetraselmis virus 1]|uniref:Uncharacterized protein n=1 Tax=Tetraselmis virus 1 TaxID=2060617 RepID=A0A2P0VNK9_9VIRU|nr:hypothetical protein QJ968_gp237 [Tetraselmis virus 1]AUF82329.1 hypothetical protein TetV_237 [Tetraselmis virus 1]
MWTIDIGSKIGAEYVPVAEDIIRLLVIQIFIQALLSIIDADSGFFNPVFWLILAYVVLATLVYHLVFKKLVEIK